MIAETDKELPFYFGSDGDLFGVYHAGVTPAARAVLLCPPLGQDQIRCHRLYRQLAHALVTEGIAVLRFDYYGSGDSAGASAELDWDRCIADTVVAGAELRRHSETSQIVAFGARLGGSIALAAAGDAHFAEVVAWDPVLDGDAYVAQLDTLQNAMRQDLRRFAKPRAAADAAAQWLGFPISPRLRAQLAGLRIEPPAAATLVLDSLSPPSTDRWRRLVTDAARVKPLTPTTPWTELDRLETTILSHPLIQAVIGHLRRVA